MNKLYNDTAVQAIANAIRAKNGSSDTYTIAEMSTALNDLSYYAKPTISNVQLATFEADGLPLNKLKVGINAVQDLHGYDYPWVGGAGENIFKNITWEQGAISSAEGRNYNANKVSSDTRIRIATLFPVNNGETYTIQFNAIDFEIVIQPYNANGISQTSATPYNEWLTNYQEFTATGNIAIAIRKKDGTNITPSDAANANVKINYGTYSNICPISGWDAANVSDVDDVDNPTVTQTTTIALPQTVYGGWVDVVNGVMVANKAIQRVQNVTADYAKTGFVRCVMPLSNTPKPSSTNEYNNISNTLVFDYVGTMGFNSNPSKPYSFCVANSLYIVLPTDAATDTASVNAWFESNPTYVCYELAEPIIVPLTPSLIKSLNGQNNLSVDCGEVIELEYFKEV